MSSDVCQMLTNLSGKIKVIIADSLRKAFFRFSRHEENYNFVFRGYLGGENTKITK